jgi:hypothetical protein
MTESLAGNQGLPSDLGLERVSGARRVFKRALVNPLANHLPPGLVKAVLRFTKSQLAAANWKDPGGWKSMVLCYNGRCVKPVDRLLVAALAAKPTGLLFIGFRGCELTEAGCVARVGILADVGSCHGCSPPVSSSRSLGLVIGFSNVSG